MTPIQLQKYSELKKLYKRDIVLNSTIPSKVSKYNERVSEVKGIVSNSYEYIVSSRLKIFLYNV